MVVIAIVVIAIVVIAIAVPLDLDQGFLHPRHNPRLRPDMGFFATNSFNVIL